MLEQSSEIPNHDALKENNSSKIGSVVTSNSNIQEQELMNSSLANDDLSEAEISSKESISVEDTGSKTLEEALAKYQIELSPKKIRLLKEYCELLWTWNERLNLTRHNTFDKFVSRDLVDSMHISAQLQKGEHVLDVGSGGGVPGLVIAILRPDVVVELCDATGKKAEALGAIVDALDLDLNIWYAKAEDLLRTRHFHTLTIRAVGKMRSLLLMFANVWHTFDRILMIKGPNWLAERGEARHYNMFNTLALRKVDEYENPGAEHGSVILQICKKARVEEMERRAKERIEGLPYDGQVEDIVVDNRPREVSENLQRPTGSRFRRKSNNHDTQSLSVNKKQKRSDHMQGDNVVSANRVNSSQTYGRNYGKPPKGWTGKKSEFKTEQKSYGPGGSRNYDHKNRQGSSKPHYNSNARRSSGSKSSERNSSDNK